jgi:hypothetical protein
MFRYLGLQLQVNQSSRRHRNTGQHREFLSLARIFNGLNVWHGLHIIVEESLWCMETIIIVGIYH